ncbi:pyrimidine 5'-nucleotidase [Sphingoaurantiacus capsulatus]|uniref:Pyrimidine 5'-nucleotidase n=1 Tax=Sphingoaurantiacus capsulatus TaxID=1771310 RepID=A0ABV7XCG0_9SPHN
MDLSRISTWIFDLDNTLYPPSANLFGQIDVRMGDYISRLLACDRAEAYRVQKAFFHEHGTTLRGLMDHHDVSPNEFLSYVHDVDMDVLEQDVRVIEGIAALPGRKLVFTNGDAPYAGKVLDRLGLAHAFESIFDIHATDYIPKPDPRAYQGLCDAYGIDPTTALFVEDMARNLRPAKAIGMTTVWVNNGSERGDHEACASYIDIEINDVGAWLAGLNRELS